MKAVRATGVLRSAVTIAVCGALAVLTGCGFGRASISGKVMYHNAPVTGGIMTLYPASGNPFSVPIEADGTFHMDGAPTGDVQVAISTENVTETRLPPGGTQGGPGFDTAKMTKKVNIPKKYEDSKTSGLSWNIKSGTNPEKTFDLTD